MKLTEAQVIELFHLVFLDVAQKGSARGRLVLKGGANLRYFFESVRYSEDLDLDIVGEESWALAEKVDAVLDSPATERILRSGGLAIVSVTKPKQTATTRRWKIALEAPSHPKPIRTKIELSNRNGDQRYELEAVPNRIVEPYALRAPKTQHYLAGAATEQKIEALAGRSETQARDVFDLDLLLRRQPLEPGSVEPELLQAAVDRALELPFDAFDAQVLPFIETEVADLYDADAWDQMKMFVAEKLGGAS
jgi:predicted nucleotidyltransferase component of viral defense system